MTTQLETHQYVVPHRHFKIGLPLITQQEPWRGRLPQGAYQSERKPGSKVSPYLIQSLPINWRGSRAIGCGL